MNDFAVYYREGSKVLLYVEPIRDKTSFPIRALASNLTNNLTV